MSSHDGLRTIQIRGDFPAVVSTAGRVRWAAGPPLPSDVRARVAGCMATLRREHIPVLDVELGVTYPLVRIVPACWWRELRDGSGGTPHARVAPIETDAGWVYGVQVAAASLLEMSAAQREGLLAHEYQHYVWMTLQAHDAMRADAGSIGTDIPGYDHSFEAYEAADKVVAVDDTWLSPRLAELARAIESQARTAAKTRLTSAILENWVQADLPIEKYVEGYNFAVNAFLLDEEIIRRAESNARKSQWVN
jgi:hypothetical protein